MSRIAYARNVTGNKRDPQVIHPAKLKKIVYAKSLVLDVKLEENSLAKTGIISLLLQLGIRVAQS